jgi:hypothetical protein
MTVVGLSEAQVEVLLRRCRGRLRMWRALRVIEAWSRTCWPGLALLLLAVAAARAFAQPLGWAPAAFACTLLGSLAWTLRAGVPQLPDWWLAARVDRIAGARGALLQRFELGTARNPIPASAAAVPLGPRVPWRLLAGVAMLSAAYALCLAIPIPHSQAMTPVDIRPLPVQRVEQLIKRVDTRAAADRAFVANARKTLSALAAKQGGLGRSDFDALERIEQRASSLLERKAAAAGERAKTLDALDQLVAVYQAEQGGQGTAGALQQHIERERDELERAGLDGAMLQKLAEQASKQAAKQGKDGQGKGKGQSGFDPEAADSLRAAIGEMRKLSEQAAKQDQQGSGGVDRGPGIASLEMSHKTQSANGARFDADTFSTAPSRDTVLLGSSQSKRGEDRHADPQGTTDRQFETGTDTEFWPKHVEPRHRALLEHYFGSNAHD